MKKKAARNLIVSTVVLSGLYTLIQIAEKKRINPEKPNGDKSYIILQADSCGSMKSLLNP